MNNLNQGKAMNKWAKISLATTIISTMMTAPVLADEATPKQAFVPPPPGPYQSQIKRPTVPPQRPMPPAWMQRAPQRPMPPAWMQRAPQPHWATAPAPVVAPKEQDKK